MGFKEIVRSTYRSAVRAHRCATAAGRSGAETRGTDVSGANIKQRDTMIISITRRYRRPMINVDDKTKRSQSDGPGGGSKASISDEARLWNTGSARYLPGNQPLNRLGNVRIQIGRSLNSHRARRAVSSTGLSVSPAPHVNDCRTATRATVFSLSRVRHKYTVKWVRTLFFFTNFNNFSCIAQTSLNYFNLFDSM